MMLTKHKAITIVLSKAFSAHTDTPVFSFQCCFTSTEIIRFIRDGHLRTFTQLLCSDPPKILLYYIYSHKSAMSLLERWG